MRVYDDPYDAETCDPGIVERFSARGDTLVFQIQVYQPPPANTAPQNLTGWFLQFTAKYQTADQDNQAVAISKTTGVSPNIITFPFGITTGIAQVSAGPLNTITLGDGKTRLVYDVVAIDPSGNKTQVERGRWTIRAGSTRTTVPD